MYVCVCVWGGHAFPPNIYIYYSDELRGLNMAADVTIRWYRETYISAVVLVWYHLSFRSSGFAFRSLQLVLLVQAKRPYVRAIQNHRQNIIMFDCLSPRLKACTMTWVCPTAMPPKTK
jgi:hypothetical protein